MSCNKFVALLFLFIQSSLSPCPSNSVDFSLNYVLNGNFQDPQLPPSQPYQTFSGSYGPWSATTIQIGHGINYNTNWGNTQVANLDSGVNQDYKQRFNLTAGQRFYFQVSHTKRQNQTPSTSGMKVYWNGQLVSTLPSANDDLIRRLNLNLTAIQGVNQIIIAGEGQDNSGDRKGTTIDDVAIYPITTLNNLIQINGSCICQSGYIQTTNLQCFLCSSLIGNCTSCSFTGNASLLTLACLNNITSGLNCSSGEIICNTCYQNFTNNVTFCEFNQSYISPTPTPSPSPNPGPNPNPGPTPSPSNSITIYTKTESLQYINCNSFRLLISFEKDYFPTIIQLAVNNSYIQVKNFSIINSKSGLYQLEVNCLYNGQISMDIIDFMVSYNDSTMALQNYSIQIQLKKANVILAYYTDQECKKLTQVQQLALFIVASTYIISIVSLLSFKIIGLQLIGVLQLAFFTLSNHDQVNIYLSPLLKWKYISGINIKIEQTAQNLPLPIQNMQYTDNFFYNINIMFGIMLLDLIIGFILLKISSNFGFKKLQTISMFILKQLFLTFFLFNTFNLSFSIGLHFKYASSSVTSNYWVGTLGACLSIIISLATIFVLQIVSQEGFGQFKSKFKNNCITKIYIPVTIMYRFVLGIYLSLENQWFLSPLLIISASIAFILFNLINLPFAKAYQNYRANFCHITQLIILITTDYYRTMKVNEPLNKKAHLTNAAIIQLICICSCIVISFFCLAYQISTMIKKFLRKRSSSSISPIKREQIKVEKNNLNVTSQNLSLNQHESKQNNYITVQFIK